MLASKRTVDERWQGESSSAAGPGWAAEGLGREHPSRERIFLEVFHAVTRGLDSAYLKPRGATQPSKESGIRLFLLKTDRAPDPQSPLSV